MCVCVCVCVCEENNVFGGGYFIYSCIIYQR